MSELDGKTIPEAVEMMLPKMLVLNAKERTEQHIEKMTETLIQTYRKGRREGYLLAFEIVLREAETSGNLTTLVKRIEDYVTQQKELLMMSE